VSKRRYIASLNRNSNTVGKVELPERIDVGNAFIARVATLEAEVTLLRSDRDRIERELAALRKFIDRAGPAPSSARPRRSSLPPCGSPSSPSTDR
jgi:hypothetical protein